MLISFKKSTKGVEKKKQVGTTKEIKEKASKCNNVGGREKAAVSLINATMKVERLQTNQAQ